MSLVQLISWAGERKLNGWPVGGPERSGKFLGQAEALQRN